MEIQLHGRNVPPYLRPMLTGIQHLHGTLRWVVLVLLVLSIVKAFSGMSAGRAFGDGDRKRGTVHHDRILHVQLVLGFILYFGKGWSAMLGDPNAMASTVMRFFSLEHMATMTLAVLLGTLGYSLAKRATEDRSKFRRQAIWFTVARCSSCRAFPGPSARASKPTVGCDPTPLGGLPRIGRGRHGLWWRRDATRRGDSPGQEVSEAEARALYIRKCSLCHGDDGKLMASKSPDLSVSRR